MKSFLFRNKAFNAALLAFPTLMVASCGEHSTEDASFTDAGSISTVIPGNDLNVFFECLEADGVTLVAAHRGGTVENSIAGMTAVLSDIPAIMEVDVNVSSDRVLFLMHDDTLERATTGTGEISDRDWNYISGLTIEGPDGSTYDTPPSLADALAWADGRTILELDIKRAVRYEDVVAEVKQADATNRIIYIAYTEAQAERLHNLHPEAMISAGLNETGQLATLDNVIPADRILGWTGTRSPNPALFDELNAADVEVIFGTLGGANSIDNRIAASGEENYYAGLARDGVDIIATDRPIAAYEAMKKAGLNVASPACGVIEID